MSVRLITNLMYVESVCVCVFFPFILDIKFVGRPSRGHTGLFIHLLSAVRALIFLARRIQSLFSLVDREVEFLCTNDLIVPQPLDICVLVVRKILLAWVELTSQRVRGLRGTFELPG